MNCIYRINEITVVGDEGAKYTVYGIDAIDAYGNIIVSYTDVFFERLKAEKLVELCNECKLEIIHKLN